MRCTANLIQSWRRVQKGTHRIPVVVLLFELMQTLFLEIISNKSAWATRENTTQWDENISSDKWCHHPLRIHLKQILLCMKDNILNIELKASMAKTCSTSPFCRWSSDCISRMRVDKSLKRAACMCNKLKLFKQ
jgi:hypothetical protein